MTTVKKPRLVPVTLRNCLGNWVILENEAVGRQAILACVYVLDHEFADKKKAQKVADALNDAIRRRKANEKGFSGFTAKVLVGEFPERAKKTPALCSSDPKNANNWVKHHLPQPIDACIFDDAADFTCWLVGESIWKVRSIYNAHQYCSVSR
jgi:hypothetical protein